MIDREDEGSGFTLIELLIALAVTSLLAVVLLALLNQVSRSCQQAQSQIGPRKSARAILDYLSRDLQLAELPRDRALFYASATSQPQAAQTNNLQFLVNPPSISTTNFLYPHAAFWQIPASPGTNGGMAEVGYFVRWAPDAAGKPRSMLCRFWVPPGDTNNYRIYSTTNWVTDTIINAVAPGVENSTDSAQSYRGWFADNVLGIWVKCLDPLGNRITTNALGVAYPANAYDSRQGYRYSTAGTNIMKSGYQLSSTNYQILAELPASVEIELVIMDSLAASRLTSVPTNYSAADARTFLNGLPTGVRQGSKIFSSRVKLKNSSGN